MKSTNLPTNFKFVVTASINNQTHYLKWIKTNKVFKKGERLFQKHMVEFTDDINEAAVCKSRVKSRKLINECYIIGTPNFDKTKFTIDRYREPEFTIKINLPKNYKEEWSNLRHEIMVKVGDSWSTEKMYFSRFTNEEKKELKVLGQLMGFSEVRVIPIKTLKRLEVTLHNL